MARRRPTRIRFWPLMLVLCAAVPRTAAAEYRTIETEGLRITIDSDWGVRTAPGYLPVRFDITNVSGDARLLEINGQGTRFFRGRGATQIATGIRRAVRLARGDRVRVTLPMPVFADSENIRFEIREDGRTLERFNYTGLLSKSPPDDASVLIVAEAGTAFARAATAWPRTVTGLRGTVVVVPSTGPVPGAPPTQPLDFILPPARLPDTWLGFTSLRAVVVGSQEWVKLDETQQAALLTWTACGGDLFFIDGSLGALFPAGQAPTPPEDGVRAYYFGRIHLRTSESFSAGGMRDALTRAASLQDPNWALPANRAADWGKLAARGFRLPIPGVEGVPARAYLGILVVFSLLIGPANYWLLQRARQQVLLVLTTPLISLVFILLLAGYVVAGEGIGVRGRAVTFTMLDQARRHAVTRASVSLYAAGMTPRGGLRFARDEAVWTIGAEGTGSRESQMLDLNELQRFAAGGIQARSPGNLEVIGFRPARERLTFERTAAGMNVLNGLGSDITALIYRDGGATYSLAGGLPDGSQAALAVGAPPSRDIVPAGLPLSSRFVHLLEHPPEGAYLAVLARSPFWNPGVTSVDERDSFHLVIGWVRGQP